MATEEPHSTLEAAYKHYRDNHDKGKCYGKNWVHIDGLLFGHICVKCDDGGCGYIMKVNPQTGRREHLDDPAQAMSQHRTWGEEARKKLEESPTDQIT